MKIILHCHHIIKSFEGDEKQNEYEQLGQKLRYAVKFIITVQIDMLLHDRISSNQYRHNHVFPLRLRL